MGPVFAVGPSHTFADLARAIDNAFARWDLSHLTLFPGLDIRGVHQTICAQRGRFEHDIPACSEEVAGPSRYRSPQKVPDL
jgi:hypothetical protein